LQAAGVPLDAPLVLVVAVLLAVLDFALLVLQSLGPVVEDVKEDYELYVAL
jgi:hypothetical protein